MKIKWVVLSGVFAVVVVLITRFVSVDAGGLPLPSREVKCEDVDPASYAFDDAALPRCAVLDAINTDYLRSIKPIFEAKCFSCHGAAASLPLYSKIPPAKWLVDYDLKHAHGHNMDMRYDYPFRADGTNKKHRHDLSEIGEVMREGEMPPWYYLILHWESGLTDVEKDEILRWVQSSRDMLKQ
jgi:mono/diheme cytochrome c family protein